MTQFSYTVVDPVCGVAVDPQNTQLTATRRGKVYYFCGIGCQQAFLREPQQFLASDFRSSIAGEMLGRIRGFFAGRGA